MSNIGYNDLSQIYAITRANFELCFIQLFVVPKTLVRVESAVQSQPMHPALHQVSTAVCLMNCSGTGPALLCLFLCPATMHLRTASQPHTIGCDALQLTAAVGKAATQRDSALPPSPSKVPAPLQVSCNSILAQVLTKCTTLLTKVIC